MEAVIKPGPRPGIELADMPQPTAGVGEVLIEVESASVCGTDYGLVDWTAAGAAWNPAFPLIMGHEYCGRVVSVGDGVERVKVGDRVAGESHVSCGHCAACLMDRRHNCLNISIPGVSTNGAFTSHLAVPESACFVLSAQVGKEAVLFESAGVAMHAIQQAGDIAGKSVLVTGTGPVGLFLISILKALGAGEILALEPNKLRRDRAAAEGATTFGVDEVEDLLAACRSAGPLRGVEVAFEVSGAAPAYQTAFAGLGLEGTLVSVGHSSNPVSVNISQDVNLRVINWQGVYGRRIWTSWERLQDLSLAGQLNLESFLEGELSIQELPDKLDEIKALPGKVLVRP